MNANKKTARAVGGLFIIGTVAGILSRVVTGPIQNAQDHLMSVPANETRLVVGALLILTMGLALAMVPVMMFPILSKQSEALALGYVVLRGGLEAVSYLAIATGWLLLVPLRACANRRATFRTWQLLEGLCSFLTSAWYISYSPIGAAS